MTCPVRGQAVFVSAAVPVWLPDSISCFRALLSRCRMQRLGQSLHGLMNPTAWIAAAQPKVRRIADRSLGAVDEQPRHRRVEPAPDQTLRPQLSPGRSARTLRSRRKCRISSRLIGVNSLAAPLVFSRLPRSARRLQLPGRAVAKSETRAPGRRRARRRYS